MGKKCIICGKEAVFCIKDSSGYYCEDCAKDNFSDLELLQKISDKAAALKERLKESEKEK